MYSLDYMHMTNGRDTKCLQVNPPGKENWPSDDHHHNNNLMNFVRLPDEKQISSLKINATKRAHPEDENVVTKDKTGVCTENYCEKWLQQELNSLVGVFSVNTLLIIFA